MCGSVPYSAHDIFNVEQKGMACEISVLVISQEAIRQLKTLTVKFFFFKWKWYFGKDSQTFNGYKDNS